MKKNGFSLLEMLIVIALLAAVSVTVGVSISGMQKRLKEKNFINYIQTIEDAACVYAENNDISEDEMVTIDNLIKIGLIKKTLVNPKTNLKITDYSNDVVEIKWENNEKKCFYNYENNN